MSGGCHDFLGHWYHDFMGLNTTDVCLLMSAPRKPQLLAQPLQPVLPALPHDAAVIRRVPKNGFGLAGRVEELAGLSPIDIGVQFSELEQDSGRGSVAHVVDGIQGRVEFLRQHAGRRGGACLHCRILGQACDQHIGPDAPLYPDRDAAMHRTEAVPHETNARSINLWYGFQQVHPSLDIDDLADTPFPSRARIVIPYFVAAVRVWRKG